MKPGVLSYLTVVYDTADKGITEIAPINSNLSLWLDASELTSAEATWTDKSGNNNSATKNGSPSVVTNTYNGLSVIATPVEVTTSGMILTTFEPSLGTQADSTNTGFMLG